VIDHLAVMDHEVRRGCVVLGGPGKNCHGQAGQPHSGQQVAQLLGHHVVTADRGV